MNTDHVRALVEATPGVSYDGTDVSVDDADALRGAVYQLAREAALGERAGEPKGWVGQPIDRNRRQRHPHQLMRIEIRPTARIQHPAAIEDRAHKLGIVVVLGEIVGLRHFQQCEAADTNAQPQRQPGQ